MIAPTSEPFLAPRAQSEVKVPFHATFAAADGFGPYTWSLSAGSLPPGLTVVNGAITGTPTTAGSYAFVVSAADREGRKTNYAASIIVADKLVISTLVHRPAKVGRLYAATIKTSGALKPASWRVVRGPLPRGIRFNRTLGTLSGIPKVAGRYRVTFQATDGLGVVSKKTLTILVAK